MATEKQPPSWLNATRGASSLIRRAIVPATCSVSGYGPGSPPVSQPVSSPHSRVGRVAVYCVSHCNRRAGPERVTVTIHPRDHIKRPRYDAPTSGSVITSYQHVTPRRHTTPHHTTPLSVSIGRETICACKTSESQPLPITQPSATRNVPCQRAWADLAMAVMTRPRHVLAWRAFRGFK